MVLLSDFCMIRGEYINFLCTLSVIYLVVIYQCYMYVYVQMHVIPGSGLREVALLVSLHIAGA